MSQLIGSLQLHCGCFLSLYCSPELLIQYIITSWYLVCFPLKSSRPTCNAIFYHMPFEEGHPIFFFFLNPSSLHSYCSSLPECSGDFVPGPPSTPAGSSLDHAPATEPAHWPFASHHDAACHGAIVPFLCVLIVHSCQRLPPVTGSVV